MPAYILTIFCLDSPLMSINLVLGVEVEGENLYFWFEPSKIRTCQPLRPGEYFRLERER